MTSRRLTPLACVLALLGPLGFAAGIACVSGRGSTLPAWLLALAGSLGIAVGLGQLAARRHPLAWLAVLEALGLWLFADSFRGHELPPTGPYAYALPAAHPPPSMSVEHIVTAVIARTASFAYRGGGFDDHRIFTMNSVLVRHPAGDLLIDTGLSSDVERHLALMPLPFRLITSIERRATASQALQRAGYAPAKLRAIVPTHAHWDHMSGVAELAPVPCWLPATERHFMRSGWITAVARSVPPERLVSYAFDAGPYLHFASSRDVFGDGSVVIVPAPGHTPGSVIVFVASPERRFVLLGDLAWQLEGVLERRERPWLTRLGDHDPEAVRAELARMAALHARYPELVLVPAHDPRAYAHIPPLRPRDVAR